MEWSIKWEPTPNPQSLKFRVNQPISDEVFEADSPGKAKRSPLAAKILGFPWAKSVFLSKDFLTVTKEEWVDWDILTEPLLSLIKEHLQEGGKVLLPKPKVSSSAKTDKSDTAQLIKEIIETEVQPAVAMDGGYIDFVSYENKKVYLNLQGACSGCPSSSYTLKEGIEMRLKQSIPEIEEVIAV